MEAVSLNPPVPFLQEPTSSDEIHMNESVLFSDSLKDLKNLRKQLYSAAEYFELSYTNDYQRDIVVNTLKDYAVKAIVNTVDHLGSVSYKVNDLLDKKVDEVSGTEILVSCIEQRLKSCQEFIDREGLSQQSSVMNIPKYHKRYILPVGETMNGANGVEPSTSRGCSDEDEWHHFRHVVRASIGGTPPSTVGHSPSPSSRFPEQNGSYLVSIPTIHRKELEKRKTCSNQVPTLPSESGSTQRTTPKKSRSTTPNPSRPITPNPSSIGKQQQKGSETQRSASMGFLTERFQSKEDSEHNNGSKGKRLLKALLSQRKMKKKDDMLYTYLDEY